MVLHQWGVKKKILGFQNSPPTGRPSLVYDLETLYGEVNFQLTNAKVSFKCRNKFHLPLRTVVLVFSVQSDCKLCPF